MDNPPAHPPEPVDTPENFRGWFSHSETRQDQIKKNMAGDIHLDIPAMSLEAAEARADHWLECFIRIREFWAQAQPQPPQAQDGANPLILDEENLGINRNDWERWHATPICWNLIRAFVQDGQTLGEAEVNANLHFIRHKGDKAQQSAEYQRRPLLANPKRELALQQHYERIQQRFRSWGMTPWQIEIHLDRLYYKGEQGEDRANDV